MIQFIYCCILAVSFRIESHESILFFCVFNAKLMWPSKLSQEIKKIADVIQIFAPHTSRHCFKLFLFAFTHFQTIYIFRLCARLFVYKLNSLLFRRDDTSIERHKHDETIVWSFNRETGTKMCVSCIVYVYIVNVCILYQTRKHISIVDIPNQMLISNS